MALWFSLRVFVCLLVFGSLSCWSLRILLHPILRSFWYISWLSACEEVVHSLSTSGHIYYIPLLQI
ncbi:hypothetical protein BJY00DRAFT_108370 [Aspergillus carlsbadensis]|nr:hypothetical protein BJY00DRAFT_108370 [Aspergillus carlsbadensis]